MSYASKAQLQTLAGAIKQKFAKKIDPEAISGNAQQILATVGVDDKVPYNFRTSGGPANIGNRLNDKIVGGTIAWNQCIPVASASQSKTEAGVTVTDNRDGSFTLNGTSDSSASVAYIPLGHFAMGLVKGRKYFLASKNAGLKIIGTPESYFEYSGVFSNTAGSGNAQCYIVCAKGTVYNNIKVYLNCFDLTQMFGSTIADYIYSLEQATAGAGVAWFKNLFPKPYYEYNAGELMSVCTNAHITRGFNAYNHETGKAILIGGNTYQITGTYTSLSYSTGEAISPDASGKFTPTEKGVLTVAGGNATDTCVHLVWSGYRNGEYEPYVEHQYPLSPIELRGIPKLDSANNLYFDGDTYKKDGTVTRKYGIVDMGTLRWRYLPTHRNERFVVGVPGIKKPSTGSEKGNIVCSKYITDSVDNVYSHVADKIIGAMHTSEELWVYDSAYTDADAIKAAMSGVYLVYELATPTTETANPFADPQIVDDFGTEEYIDALATAETSPRDVAIPVGHETFYQANLRDKLQNLPANANADGLYLVKQTGNKQELIAYTPESELPTSPAETGTYVLKLIDGTLTWVSES